MCFCKSSLGLVQLSVFNNVEFLVKMLFSQETDLLESQRTVKWKQIWSL